MAKDLDFTTKNGALSRVNIFTFDPFVLVIVEEDPSHPLYDERAAQAPPESFVTSVMVNGAITPIEVRRGGEDDGVAINEVVDGRKRVQSARIATTRMRRFRELADKGASIARIAKELDIDVETAEIWREAFEGRAWEAYTVNGVRVSGDAKRMRTMVVELNEQRVEDSVLVKAKKYQRLLENGIPEFRARIAAGGISKGTAKNWIALLECSPHVQRAVETGKVGATVATKLSKLDHEEQPKALEEMIAAGATKGAAASNAVKQAARGEKITREKPEQWVMNGRGLVKLEGEPPKGMKLRTLRVWMSADATA